MIEVYDTNISPILAYSSYNFKNIYNNYFVLILMKYVQ